VPCRKPRSRPRQVAESISRRSGGDRGISYAKEESGSTRNRTVGAAQYVMRVIVHAQGESSQSVFPKGKTNRQRLLFQKLDEELAEDRPDNLPCPRSLRTGGRRVCLAWLLQDSIERCAEFMQGESLLQEISHP